MPYADPKDKKRRIRDKRQVCGNDPELLDKLSRYIREFKVIDRRNGSPEGTSIASKYLRGVSETTRGCETTGCTIRSRQSMRRTQGNHAQDALVRRVSLWYSAWVVVRHPTPREIPPVVGWERAHNKELYHVS